MNSKVVVLRSDWLPYSETFIREQMLHMRRWQPVGVGFGRRVPGLSLTGLNCRFLRERTGLMSQGARLFLQLFGVDILGLSRLIKKTHGQLLHVHFATDATVFWPLIKRLEIPVVVTLHGYDITIHPEMWRKGRGARFMRKYPDRLKTLAQAPQVNFIAVSEDIRRQAIARGIPEKKITVCHIGIDTRAFVPGAEPISDRRQITFIGRLVEKKGCAYLLDAVSRLQQRFPDALLEIIGDGPLTPTLKAQAERLGVRCKFSGAQNSNYVRAALDRTRVFCLPSVTAENGDAEGFGMVLLEAQASGVPVVTSARGGAKEGIIHGKTGFAFAEKDTEGLTAALIRLFEDDVLADAMGAAAVKFCRDNMDIRDCTRRLERYYSALVENQ